MTNARLPAMTPDELASLIRKAVREELHAAGLRVDEPMALDEARRDFMFLRRMRNSFDGAASKVGYTILLAATGGFLWLVTQGLSFWKGN